MARRRITHDAGRDALNAWAGAAETASPAAAAGLAGAAGSADAAGPAETAGPAEPDGALDRRTIATAVRYLLEELAETAPGNSVEVRVPPFGVAQCGEGPRHTRGTPPNVVELNATAWLELATGTTTWDQALAAGRINASGTRADLSGLLPLACRDCPR